jgi:hypothetical protein
MPDQLLPVTFASGSAGDTVYSRNASGAYTRPRVTPIDPNTSRMQRVRSRWANITAMWAGTLTGDQRALWNEYGSVRVRKREDGRIVQLSGQQWFMHVNQSRQVVALGTILTPPTTLTAPAWQLPGVNNFIAAGAVTVQFDNTEAWANEAGGALIVFVGMDQPTSHTFFAGPWRRAGFILGNPGVPPISPRNLSDPFVPTTAFNRWFRAYVIQADGRVATPRRGQFQ